YEDYAQAVFSLPYVIGWHHCGYIDQWSVAQGPRQHSGIKDVWESPYKPLIQAMKQVNTKIYHIAACGRNQIKYSHRAHRESLLTPSMSLFSPKFISKARLSPEALRYERTCAVETSGSFCKAFISTMTSFSTNKSILCPCMI
ncbi:hypothetical protein LCGC14_2384280, partial [marine sediment metagenome]